MTIFHGIFSTDDVGPVLQVLVLLLGVELYPETTFIVSTGCGLEVIIGGGTKHEEIEVGRTTNLQVLLMDDLLMFWVQS